MSFAIHLSQLDELTKLVKFPRYLGCFCIFLTEHRVETSYVYYVKDHFNNKHMAFQKSDLHSGGDTLLGASSHKL